MATKPETTFRKKVVAYLKTFPKDRLWFESIQQKAIRGTPDLICCANGHFLAIEIKSRNGELSEIQKLKMHEILCAKGAYFVLYPDDFEEFKILMDRLVYIG